MIIHLLAMQALAATYSVEVAVPSVYPSSIANGGLVGYARFVAESTQNDMSTSSSDSRIKCVLRDGFVAVEFLAKASNWPTSFPVTTSCAHGTDTLNIAIVEMSAATDPALQSATISTTNTIELTKVQGSQIVRVYPLPADTYTAGLYNSTLMNTKCGVAEDTPGDFSVQIRSGENAPMGTGTCSIPRPGKSNFVLNLDIDDAAI